MTNNIYKLVACLLGLLSSSYAYAKETVPFALPYDDGSRNVVSADTLLVAPAGKEGYVHAGKDGRLYSGEQPIRFLGFNLGADANFPEHEIVDLTANRLAKFGVNAVRFHHMDFGWAPEDRNIFGIKPENTLHADPESLDRLGYFIAALKAKGIYTNLNLLCSRDFSLEDGLPEDIDKLSSKDAHRIGMFYEPLIKLQKRFAKQLLTYENPYTGITLAEDPAVAIVEINNENGLVAGWLSGYTGLLRDGPVPKTFEEDLQRQWNEWLSRKYSSMDALSKAWGIEQEAEATNILRNGGFEDGVRNWVLNTQQGAEAKADAVSTEFYKHVGMVEVLKAGSQPWTVEFYQVVDLEPGKGYTLKFRARAKDYRTIKVRMQETESPWSSTSLDQYIRLKPYWQDFKFSFLADKAKLRVNFSSLSNTGAQFFFKDVSLVGSTLPEGQSLEAGNLALDTSAISENALKDWVAFLYFLESRYWKDMYDYLRKDLGYRSLIVGSQVGFSTPMLMSEQDVVDTHYYWQHPKFPGRMWDLGNWYVNNVSMVNDPRMEITRLGMQRVFGKPFMVTEYDHPAPSHFAGESPIISAAYAALQDWDGLFYFLYQGDGEGWDSGMVRGFFDYSHHPAKMANMIIAANLFLRGDLKPNKYAVEVPQSVEHEQAKLLQERPSLFELGVDFYGLDPAQAVRHRVGLLPAENVGEIHEVDAEDSTPVIRSDNGQFVWDRSDTDAGRITIDTPKTKLLLGYTTGNPVALKGLEIAPVHTDKRWQIIAVTSQDDLPLLKSKRMLIVANGFTENTEMGWTDERKVSVGKDWGKAPSRIEVISAQLSFKHEGSIRVWALNETGERADEIAVSRRKDGFYVFTIGKGASTLWYEIEAVPPA